MSSLTTRSQAISTSFDRATTTSVGPLDETRAASKPGPAVMADASVLSTAAFPSTLRRTRRKPPNHLSRCGIGRRLVRRQLGPEPGCQPLLLSQIGLQSLNPVGQFVR